VRTMSTTLDTSTPTVDNRADRATTWRDVLRGAATGQAVLAAFLFAVSVALEGKFDPMPLVIGLVALGGVALLAKRPGKGGVIYAGIVSLLLFLMVVAFGGLTVFTRAESTFELIVFGGLLVVTVLGLVSFVGALRRSGGGRAAALAPRIAGGLIALLVAVGVVAGVLTGSATRMPGDIALQTKNFEFTETELEADRGRVAVFVENEDVAHHDFTIKDVVTTELPGKKAGRAVFELDAGTYRFYCSLHPGMEGTLKLS
jgi:plastocyanin